MECREFMATPLRLELDEQKLLLGLLKILSDGWVSPAHFDRLLSDHQIPEGAPAIYFLTGIQQVLRELPFKVYLDDNSRSAIIDAAQAALDAAIAREDAMPDSDEAESPDVETVQRGRP
jgi:type III secretion system TyeA family effector delivery regulator